MGSATIGVRCPPARRSIARSTPSGLVLPQQPPAYSAKKVDGKRRPHILSPGASRAASGPRRRLPARGRCGRFWVDPRRSTFPRPRQRDSKCDHDRHRRGGPRDADVVCSAGFYVRSLAHDLGERLGVGGHIVALRRTERRPAIDRTIELRRVERRPGLGRPRQFPCRRMLPARSAPVALTQRRGA